MAREMDKVRGQMDRGRGKKRSERSRNGEGEGGGGGGEAGGGVSGPDGRDDGAQDWLKELERDLDVIEETLRMAEGGEDESMDHGAGDGRQEHIQRIS